MQVEPNPGEGFREFEGAKAALLSCTDLGEPGAADEALRSWFWRKPEALFHLELVLFKRQN